MDLLAKADALLVRVEIEERRAQLNEKVRQASLTLKSFPKTGLMGMTGDETKKLPSYQAAKKAYDEAFAELRAFNTRYKPGRG